MRRKARRTMISDNFFAHVDQSGGPDACWPFLRSKNAKGYGRVWVNGRCEEAHRHAFALVNGPIPAQIEGQIACVLHACDFPSCCNPKHLRLGTKFDNAQDREIRGRGNQPVGEASGSSKLSTRDVLFIKRCADIYNSYEMAEMLGVQNTAISRVLNGEVWAHVSDLPPAQAINLSRAA